ncbi:MAG: hypothetical protein FGM37_01825 [Phycisphaerales bacterium]|nr:hypothetical protein [Phycisphaerales bacterium]
MSEHAQIDSERLERFRQELENHLQHVRTGLGQIRNQSDTLANRWRDEQFRNFRQSLERSNEKIEQFMADTGRQIEHLAELVRASREIERGTL